MVLFQKRNLSSGQSNFKVSHLLKRKDNSSRGSRWRLWALLCCHTLSTPSLRNINLIPFRLRASSLYKEFPNILGSSHPCPIAVVMETFSTSAFKVLIWIIATTTKIRTKRCSTQTYVKASKQRSRPPTYCLVKFETIVEYGSYAWAPSIFRANSFGRWVVTHSLADSYFHGHRPAV